MSFDDIPEDRCISYPCPVCENGDVTQNYENDDWECNECDFISQVKPT